MVCKSKVLCKNAGGLNSNKQKTHILLKLQIEANAFNNKKTKQRSLRHGCAYCYRPHDVVLVPKPVTPTNRQQKLVQDEECEEESSGSGTKTSKKHPVSHDQQEEKMDLKPS